MPTVGANAPQDVMGLLVRTVSQQTTTTGDIDLSTVFACGICRRVIPQSGGTIYLKHTGDTGNAVSYLAIAGQPIDGEFILIGGTTNYPSATSGMVVNCEL